MLFEYNISTKVNSLYNIMEYIQDALKKSKITNGICVIYCPHTTAAITINENADSDVVTDFIRGISDTFPNSKEYLHSEGNSDAHIKSSVIGCSETIILNEGKLLLGTWQSVYFCEFDAPRNRRFYIKIL